MPISPVLNYYWFFLKSTSICRLLAFCDSSALFPVSCHLSSIILLAYRSWSPGSSLLLLLFSPFSWVTSFLYLLHPRNLSSILSPSPSLICILLLFLPVYLTPNLSSLGVSTTAAWPTGTCTWWYRCCCRHCWLAWLRVGLVMWATARHQEIGEKEIVGRPMLSLHLCVSWPVQKAVAAKTLVPILHITIIHHSLC